MSIALVRYDAACKAIAEARAVDEIKDWRDKGLALQAYGRQAKNKQLEIDAAEIRWRAERRLGELLAEQKANGGLATGHRFTGGSDSEPPAAPTLAELGIDKKLSSRAQQTAAIPDDVFEQTMAEHREAQRAVTTSTVEKLTKHGVHFSSETVEHYTPEHIIESAMHTMGDIDLDPCADPDKRVPAGAHFTKDDDGLTQEWGGRVYMNPPYGREIRVWVDKLHGEFTVGRMEQGIALVPARTDTAWWSVLADYPVCFISGRLTFIGNSDPAPFPSAVVFVAHEKAWPRFAAEWRQHGLVYVPWGRS